MYAAAMKTKNENKSMAAAEAVAQQIKSANNKKTNHHPPIFGEETVMTPSGNLDGETEATEGNLSNKQTNSIQRKIGAEIEVVGATLDYDVGTSVSQGEKVGAIVPGIETEIHLEAPNKKYATFELATGLHDQYPPENPLSLTFQVAYLADFVKIAKIRGKSLLKDMPLMALEAKWAEVNNRQGPILQVQEGSQGAFQINVSPTKATSSTFLDIFDLINSFTFEDHVLIVQEKTVNTCLDNAKQFSIQLYNNIVEILSKKLGAELPSILKSTIRALVNVPRVSYFKYLRSQEDFFSPTKDIIDKNILDALPRANIQELWTSALKDSTVDPKTAGLFPATLKEAFDATDYPKLAEGNIPSDKEDLETYSLLEKMDHLINGKPEGWMEQLKNLDLDFRIAKLQDKITQGPNIFHANFLKISALNDTLAVLRGEKILIKNRKTQETQAEAILKNTDSSLLHVNKEEGEAGVFEIRNPFTHQIPIDQWAEVMAAYEAMLYQKGVRY